MKIEPRSVTVRDVVAGYNEEVEGSDRHEQ